MADKTLYTADSIESLSPLAFTRLRPGVYCGSTQNPNQLIIEIVANSLDEFRLGHGDRIEVSINDKNAVRVADYGQGFPYSIREDGKSILEASFSVLNTSGKYRSDGVYEGTSLGLNGIGSKLPVYLSHWAVATSYRDGKGECVSFKEGVFDNRDLFITTRENGTIVEWQPSEEFFTTIEFDTKALTELFQTLVCLCPGLTIEFDNKGSKTTFFSQRGLNDLVDAAVKDNEIIKNRFNFNFKNGKNAIDMAMTYTSNYSFTLVPYVNTGLTNSGPHITGIKTLITREFNKFFKEKGWLKEKDANLTGDDIQEGMYIVFNITAPDVSYDAQTKTRLVKIDMAPFNAQLAEGLRQWLATNEKAVKIIADKAINARKAREAARKARDVARESSNKKDKGLKAKMKLSDKFIDCGSRDPANRNLLLVEGLSAGSSAIEARNPKTDCIYMLKGKILSVLKQDESKVLSNQELSDIIKIIGAGYKDTFDLAKMNFNRVVIVSDADSDGANIELLCITFFYTYMRKLIEDGRLYRAITPLYIIRNKGKEEYLYTEAEMDEYKRTHSSGYEVLRAKGLGELNPADLRKVCFENERYKRITINDAVACTELLNTLMGTNVEKRKQYIYDNAKELGFNFD